MKNYLTTLYDHLPESAVDPRPTLPPPLQTPTARPSPFQSGWQGKLQGANVQPFDFSKFGRPSPFGAEAIPPGEDPRDPNPTRPAPKPNRNNAPPVDENAIPRPIARSRWNPEAANFGELQKYWQQGIAMWGQGFAQEMGGYPQNAVADLLSVMKMNEDSMRTTGKPAMVKVNDQLMNADQAVMYLRDQMRDIASKVDANYIATKKAVEDKAKFDADQLNKIPLMPRISPITFQ